MAYALKNSPHPNTIEEFNQQHHNSNTLRDASSILREIKIAHEIRSRRKKAKLTPILVD